MEAFDRKTGENRTVYYQESLDFLLEEWLDAGYRDSYPASQQSEYLFLTRLSQKMNDRVVNQIVRKAAEEAEIQEVVYKDANGSKRHKITGHTLDTRTLFTP